MTRQDRTPDDTRETLIDVVLSHVPFDGWSDKALLAAAADCAISPTAARRAFPRGAASQIAYHAARADRRLEQDLDAEAFKGFGVRQRIAAAVKRRLELEEPHWEAVRAALAYGALPLNAGLSLSCLYHSVDSMWFAIGDKSTDFNFYTKRGLLAAVYGSTVLFWLADRSEGQADTWAFLERRIADVMKIPALGSRLRRMGNRLPDAIGLFRAVRARAYPNQ